MPAAGGAARHGSVISARLVPAPNPAHRMPTLTLPLPPRCIAALCGASVPSGGVQLGVGELVSALAAPSPLIAGGNTVLAIVRILTLTLLQVLVPSAGIRGFLDASDFPTWLKFVRRSSRSNLRHVLLGGQIFYQTVRKLFFFIILILQTNSELYIISCTFLYGNSPDPRHSTGRRVIVGGEATNSVGWGGGGSR